VRDVRRGTGRIIDDEASVGGWPMLRSRSASKDSDGDGMPDRWEKKRKLDPNDPSDAAGDADGDGYTNLDDYLNALLRPT
jgi:hypothetical protein